jgi:hypothetical protein
MYRLLIVLILIGACVVGLGFFLEWFRVTSDGGDGRSQITFTLAATHLPGLKRIPRLLANALQSL